jgi:hypothetical protein
MGGRQANQDNKQADGRSAEQAKGAAPQKTGSKPTAPSKPERR